MPRMITLRSETKNKPVSEILLLKYACAQRVELLKDGAYIWYCAYVLRMSRYLGFLWVVPTNTGRKQTLASALGIPKENWE